jgi:hypothetical protein
MRQVIHDAASLLGPCWSISHVIGGPGQVFRIAAGHPEHVQDLLASEVRHRFLTPPSKPAELVVVGNYPWPGDPMQSFKVLLHHRAACQSRGVLIGVFWTDLGEIDRSLPVAALQAIAALGRFGSWSIRRCLPIAERMTALAETPMEFMIHWARELVVDRSVLVYAPTLYKRVGSYLGPVRLFATQAPLWEAAISALRSSGCQTDAIRVRVFPYGGLSYVPCGKISSGSKAEPA